MMFLHKISVKVMTKLQLEDDRENGKFFGYARARKSTNW